jgi:hypothetical protein
MNYRTAAYTAVVLSFAFSSGAARPASSGRLVAVSRDKLCITEGALEELPETRLAVNVPKMRAVVAAVTPQIAEARLKYLGPTSTGSPLGSGEMRRQLALKLRAQDGCNLVYASWRIEPKSELVVSIKSNPGMHTSSECGNHGYRNIKPRHAASVPTLKSGDAHALLAQMDGSKLRVSVDGNVVWDGDLGPEALAFDGPVGVRTDNGRFEFEFRTGELGAPRACKTSDGD